MFEYAFSCGFRDSNIFVCAANLLEIIWNLNLLKLLFIHIKVPSIGSVYVMLIWLLWYLYLHTRGWDQFEVNKTLFGVKSTFDEELYTTRLERGPQTRELEREAQRIAREIEGEQTHDLHLAEVRLRLDWVFFHLSFLCLLFIYLSLVDCVGKRRSTWWTHWDRWRNPIFFSPPAKWWQWIWRDCGHIIGFTKWWNIWRCLWFCH